MLYFIGIGLAEPKDITVKGLEIVRRCKRVYLEAYTSILPHGCDYQALSEFYGCPVLLADRNLVENNSDELLNAAKEEDVAILVVGDPLVATTHTDLILRSRRLGIGIGVVHNASIFNAIASCGLQLYTFGETVSIPFWTEEWKPESFYDKILSNKNRGLHTLCLLDIKVKEQSIENLIKGRDIFEPSRFMSCAVAAQQLLSITSARLTDERPSDDILVANAECIAVARLGSADQKCLLCILSDIPNLDMGAPLHSLIVIGSLHPIEREAIEIFIRA